MGDADHRNTWMEMASNEQESQMAQNPDIKGPQSSIDVLLASLVSNEDLSFHHIDNAMSSPTHTQQQQLYQEQLQQPQQHDNPSSELYPLPPAKRRRMSAFAEGPWPLLPSSPQAEAVPMYSRPVQSSWDVEGQHGQLQMSGHSGQQAQEEIQDSRQNQNNWEAEVQHHRAVEGAGPFMWPTRKAEEEERESRSSPGSWAAFDRQQGHSKPLSGSAAELQCGPAGGEMPLQTVQMLAAVQQGQQEYTPQDTTMLLLPRPPAKYHNVASPANAVNPQDDIMPHALPPPAALSHQPDTERMSHHVGTSSRPNSMVATLRTHLMDMLERRSPTASPASSPREPQMPAPARTHVAAPSAGHQYVFSDKNSSASRAQPSPPQLRHDQEDSGQPGASLSAPPPGSSLCVTTWRPQLSGSRSAAASKAPATTAKKPVSGHTVQPAGRSAFTWQGGASGFAWQGGASGFAWRGSQLPGNKGSGFRRQGTASSASNSPTSSGGGTWQGPTRPQSRPPSNLSGGMWQSASPFGTNQAPASLSRQGVAWRPASAATHSTSAGTPGSTSWPATSGIMRNATSAGGTSTAAATWHGVSVPRHRTPAAQAAFMLRAASDPGYSPPTHPPVPTCPADLAYSTDLAWEGEPTTGPVPVPMSHSPATASDGSSMPPPQSQPGSGATPFPPCEPLGASNENDAPGQPRLLAAAEGSTDFHSLYMYWAAPSVLQELPGTQASAQVAVHRRTHVQGAQKDTPAQAGEAFVRSVVGEACGGAGRQESPMPLRGGPIFRALQGQVTARSTVSPGSYVGTPSSQASGVASAEVANMDMGRTPRGQASGAPEGATMSVAQAYGDMSATAGANSDMGGGDGHGNSSNAMMPTHIPTLPGAQAYGDVSAAAGGSMEVFQPVRNVPKAASTGGSSGGDAHAMISTTVTSGAMVAPYKPHFKL